MPLLLRQTADYEQNRKGQAEQDCWQEGISPVPGPFLTVSNPNWPGTKRGGDKDTGMRMSSATIVMTGCSYNS